MKMKKAQGLSMNTIIIAAIALIVLIILISIFTGRMSIFGQGLASSTQSECTDGNWRISCNPKTEQPNYLIVPEGSNVGKTCCVAKST